MLDGDELRASISTDLGFSKRDRDAHNMRVALLAQILNRQGFNVVVAVIAPFRSTRAKISSIVNPYWIYVKGEKRGKDMPYEEPENPDLIINAGTEALLESLERIVMEVGKLQAMPMQ